MAGCSGQTGDDTEVAPTVSEPLPDNSVFEDLHFEGPDLVVSLDAEYDVSQLNLIAPDGSAFRQTSVAEGATRASLQILFKSGGSYTAGEHELVAVTGDSTESISITLRPDLRIVDIEPEAEDSDEQSTGRLRVAVANNGSAPTWVYNVGFRNAPYPNAPQVINGVADTQFEQPDDPVNEFLSPGTQRSFLKERGVLIVSEDGDVSCDGDEMTLTVVVQTPHGDVRQRIRAHLSGGYIQDDPAAVQHPCADVAIDLIDGGTSDA